MNKSSASSHAPPKLFIVGVMTSLLLQIVPFASVPAFRRLSVGAFAWVTRETEWFSLLCLFAFCGMTWLFERLAERANLTYLPPDSRSWQYIVMGFLVTLPMVPFFVSLIGTVLILPFVVPVLLIFKYAFGPSASIESIVLVIPGILACVSAAFVFFYWHACSRKWGTITRAGQHLYQHNDVGLGYLVSVPDLVFLSLSRTFFVMPSEFELGGACQWLGLLQTVVAKLLDVLIVGVAIGLIVSRTPLAASCPTQVCSCQAQGAFPIAPQHLP